MRSFLALLITSLIGTTVIVNGVTFNTEDIIAETKTVVSETNLHQLRTALELYYLDNNHYPVTHTGSGLISELSNKGYLQSLPKDSNIFNYEVLNQGQSYTLSI